MNWILKIIEIILIIIPILLSMAFLTLKERKVLANIQRRSGPNIVGIYGILQPFSDAIKLFLKETVIPSHANKIIYLITPIITLSLALISWSVIPFNNNIIIGDINLGLLYLLGISSLSVYGVLGSGWGSNSKYAFLGGLRSTAQMISYEVSMGLLLLSVLIWTGSYNLSVIVITQEEGWNLIGLLPTSILFLISILAETNRSPFDLPEGESELVSGFNVEYSSMTFALFFLGEYVHIILMSIIFTIIFLGGWTNVITDKYWNIIGLEDLDLGWLKSFNMSIKTSLIIYWFIWVRGSYPRFRYDQLMGLVWKNILPLSIGLIMWNGSIIIATNSLNW
uniref:NADH-ubiquinone oxidoreductase chain 1 n=1 Tax=Ministeria vibrans TaxID=134558 RepID=M1JZV8_MINVI|nr:NADH dehydrogenase subunit 1 [Ministeria vibrans]AGE93687.1 NADH dehydrogenase subunit 1 [Ministeria vibrans]